jgi:ligand-binding sensor domain-containing protein
LPEQPTRRRPRRWWIPAVAIALAVVTLNAVGWALTRATTPNRRIPGIVTIRPPGEVSALALVGDTLFAGGKDGLFAIDTKSLEVTRPIPTEALPLGHVRGLLHTPDGTLWIGHDAGLTTWKGAAVRTYTTADGLPANRVQCVMRDASGVVWAGTVSGAAGYGGGKRFASLTSADGLADGMVNTMMQKSDGTLWFGSYSAPRGGVSVLRTGGFATLETAQGLPHPNVTSFLEDSDGSVWVGTGFSSRGGAARVVLEGPTQIPRVVQTLGKAQGLAGEKVRSLFKDRDGTYWFGSEVDGIAVGKPGDWRVLTTAEGLADNEVKCVLQGDDGRVWLGTRNGVSLIQDPGDVVRRLRGTP